MAAQWPFRCHCAVSGHRSKLGCTFTVLDILDEIYWEISFYGSPEDRDRESAALRESVREVEEDGATLIPWEPPDAGVN